jgi:hypothetical protein
MDPDTFQQLGRDSTEPRWAGDNKVVTESEC